MKESLVIVFLSRERDVAGVYFCVCDRRWDEIRTRLRNAGNALDDSLSYCLDGERLEKYLMKENARRS